MCGIFGGINTSFARQSVERLHHRGPDQQSFEVERIGEEFAVALGQTRLNIVDRHDIDLPVRIGKASILFNGEIYNWLELRDELVGLGWNFATKTDTEVALAAYLHWGPECLNRFNGMFAIAIGTANASFARATAWARSPDFPAARANRSSSPPR